jgi:YebC/PmpR family DNA-binding regulatory protein
MNVSLYLAIDRARSSNMPKDSIERAIKRGTGEDKSAAELEELTYGGTLGHGIVALIQCVTENRNRTVAELRHILTRSGGNLADTSSISWQFDRKAIFTVKSDGKNFDKVFEAAVEGGADDVSEEDGYIEIIGSVESFKTIGDSLKKFHIQPEEAGLQMVAQQEMELDKEKTITVLRTIEALEESDDVQNVYSNLRITEEVLADLEKE